MDDLEFRQLVERVKLRSPIENVVAERVPGLVKRGASLWARCPFHEERTPSFVVHPGRGTWHCFGACGEGGDVLRFVERFEGVSFLDALRLLARAAGETVPDVRRFSSSKAEEKRDELFDVLRRASVLFRRRLAGPDGAAARDYLAGRGLSREVLEAFGVGWAPEGNALLENANEAGVDAQRLEECGLVRRSSDGRPYDFFRARVMIPIADRLGRVVGFGGRLLPGDTRAAGKYVNSPETAVFRKASLVFGLDRAMDAVRRRKHVVLMEGYTDVMAAHQVGIDNACAVLGTATTDEHAALIRRSGAQRVTLVFDGDDAGRAATEKALRGLLSLGLTLDVVPLPAGVDPCEWLLAEPAAAERFGALLAAAPDWFRWTLEGLAARSSASEVARGVDTLFPLLARLPRPVERDLHLVELARALGLSERALREQWEVFQGRVRLEVSAPRRGDAHASRTTPRAPEGRGPGRPAGAALAYMSLAGAMLLDNGLIPLYRDRFDVLLRSDDGPDPEVDATPGAPGSPGAPGAPGESGPEDAGDGTAVSRTEALRVVVRAVLDLYDHGSDDRPVDADAVLTRLAAHPARTLVLELEELARTAESPVQLAQDQARWFEDAARRRELERLRARLGQAASAPPAPPGPPAPGAAEDASAEPVPEGAAAEEILRRLHAEMRARTVAHGARDAHKTAPGPASSQAPATR